VTKFLIPPSSRGLKLTLLLGGVKIIIPIEATTPQTSARPRVRNKSNGQFAASSPLLDSLDDAPAVNVVLMAIGDNKTAVIKMVRGIAGLTFKEAKDLAEEAPFLIREEISWSTAEAIKNALESVGATVAIQPHSSWRDNGESAPQHAEAGYGA
jgi:ribosomal protein L7/L12